MRSAAVWDNFGMASKVKNAVTAAAVAIIAAVAGVWLASRTAETPPVLTAGTWLPEARNLPDFQLTDQTRQDFGRERLAGRPSLLFFGFTNCPDVCPTTLALLSALRQKAQLRTLQIVFVSVDPERDSPAQIQRYLQGFDRDLIGLTGEPAQLETLTSALSALAQRVDLPGGDYSMDHSATVYLLNSQAQLVAVFAPPLSRELMLKDLDSVAARIG